ncbi:MAG: hypothetical protein KatS3mg111_4002 [Pirellulaceae bacterium]|nr:MAG: hypothetical protein KatS3mg111_4002 [Pirellulaceae bacterium]
MKERLLSLLATARLVVGLVMVLLPTSRALAWSSDGPQKTCGGTGCVSVGVGPELGCASTQPPGACFETSATGDGCPCLSGRNPFTGNGTCNCQ